MTKIEKSVTEVSGLAAAGLVTPDKLHQLEAVAARYAVAITPAMAELIDPADPHDPIARQFLPDARELDAKPDEMSDPIGDAAHSPVKGLVHRYPDRVLLKVVGICPVYCRFCFRREMVGPANGAPLSPAELADALSYIRARPEVWEVILTGGDPLVLSPRRIAEMTAALGEIAHVKVLRWHTRVPVVAPEMVTAELVRALRGASQAVWVAIHANHPRELTPAARAACAHLVDSGIALVSQTVLLKGINDDPKTLGELMRGFVECRIKPYYLHHGDRAPGTSHLRTTIAEGQQIVRSLRGRLSGLCQPTYVLDIPGGAGKVPVGPCHLRCVNSLAAPHSYMVQDNVGDLHSYNEPPP
jgi:lysine 2,3-aminomutase